ncbi:hypothetical protein FRC08_006443 [Ceratobasidium sp. 394]|nr:hypothetical protein FRC08_006443 [Ceratobasidium sp. 394]
MPLTQLVELGVHYALHFDSNPRNLEHHWYSPWNDILTDKRNQTDCSLSVAPQHHFTQWGSTRAQSRPLCIDDENETLPDSDDDLSEDEMPSLELDIDEFSIYEDSTAVHDPFYEVTTRSKTTSSEDPSDVFFLPPVITTPERPSGSQPGAGPSSVGTQVLNKRKDSSFILDFAILKIIQVGPESASYNIFGTNVRQSDAYIPIILEAKKPFSRKTSLHAPDFYFQHSLSIEIRKGYGDINLKAPIVFRSHRMQRSTIGIATCGLWWSFTVVTPDTQRTTWSRLFEYGVPAHDTVFDALFHAAASHPDHPLEFQNGLILDYLTRWGRRTYDKYDTLAVDLEL